MHLYYELRAPGSARFYRISWQESIPEQGRLCWLVRLRWGALGARGRSRSLWFTEREVALRKVLELHRNRLKQGYERLQRPSTEQSRFAFLPPDGTEQLELFHSLSAA